MKATTIIIAAVLSLQVSLLFAGNNETKSVVNNDIVPLNINTLAPVTPVEATFEEATCPGSVTFNYTTLAPVTPEEADFSDVVPEKKIDFTILAPVTPAEADFDDTIENQTCGSVTLAPVTPAEADFE
jgi:hypothetical protein